MINLKEQKTLWRIIEEENEKLLAIECKVVHISNTSFTVEYDHQYEDFRLDDVDKEFFADEVSCTKEMAQRLGCTDIFHPYCKEEGIEPTESLLRSFMKDLQCESTEELDEKLVLEGFV